MSRVNNKLRFLNMMRMTVPQIVQDSLLSLQTFHPNFSDFSYLFEKRKIMEKTEKVIKDLLNYQFSEALSSIQNSNINKLYIFDYSPPSDEFYDWILFSRNFQPLLHVMVLTNAKHVKFLLENGANPNILNFREQSLIEVILADLGNIIHQCILSKESISSKILEAEKIIDLLLCYGLKHNEIIWTKPFMHQVGMIFNLCKLNPEKENIDLFCLSQFQKLTEKYVVSKNQPLDNIDIISLQDWCYSTANIHKTLNASSQIIESEKKEFFPKVANIIETSMNYPELSLPFMKIILDYAYKKIEAEIADSRVARQAKTPFWESIDLVASSLENESKKMALRK